MSSELERFFDKVVFTDSCWFWIAGCSPSGYGQFRLYTRMEAAHRVSYAWFYGDLPEYGQGLELDHLCRVRACVNPSHLEAVTTQENNTRGDAAFIAAKRQNNKTHCPQDHEYSVENTYIDRVGGRRCRECHRIQCRNWRKQRRVHG